MNRGGMEPNAGDGRRGAPHSAAAPEVVGAAGPTGAPAGLFLRERDRRQTAITLWVDSVDNIRQAISHAGQDVDDPSRLYSVVVGSAGHSGQPQQPPGALTSGDQAAGGAINATNTVSLQEGAGAASSSSASHADGSSPASRSGRTASTSMSTNLLLRDSYGGRVVPVQPKPRPHLATNQPPPPSRPGVAVVRNSVVTRGNASTGDGLMSDALTGYLPLRPMAPTAPMAATNGRDGGGYIGVYKPINDDDDEALIFGGGSAAASMRHPPHHRGMPPHQEMLYRSQGGSGPTAEYHHTHAHSWQQQQQPPFLATGIASAAPAATGSSPRRVADGRTTSFPPQPTESPLRGDRLPGAAAVGAAATVREEEDEDEERTASGDDDGRPRHVVSGVAVASGGAAATGGEEPFAIGAAADDCRSSATGTNVARHDYSSSRNTDEA